jgi:transcriptional regulator with XRE-family HTH domain
MSTKQFRDVATAFQEILGDTELSDALKKQMRDRLIVKTLAALRVKKGSTQEDVANALGCKQAKISKIENGLDAALTLADIEAYAKVVDCDVAILLSPRGKTLAEQIKYHALAIRRKFLRLAKMAHQDEEIAKGVAGLHEQAFHNLNTFLQEAAEAMPLRPDNGEPYIRMEQVDLILQCEGPTGTLPASVDLPRNRLSHLLGQCEAGSSP